jgi:large subunit ribosomal protein L21
MYAIVVTGGKQHRVREGDLIQVEKIEGEVGAPIELDQVLLVAGDGDPKIGASTVAGAKVKAQIVKQGKGKKVVVFKRRPNKQYRRKYGHRQPYTHLRVTGIEVG